MGSCQSWGSLGLSLCIWGSPGSWGSVQSWGSLGAVTPELGGPLGAGGPQGLSPQYWGGLSELRVTPELETPGAINPDLGLPWELGVPKGCHPRAGGPQGPPGPLVWLPAGGQKVSFAGGMEERGDALKSLTVSEIPEDPEGPEGDEEEPGREQEDDGTGGTWGVTPAPPTPLGPVPDPAVSVCPSPERRHVGFAEVPSRPIGTERHSPTFPLGTS